MRTADYPIDPMFLARWSIPWNQDWAKAASALVYIVSDGEMPADTAGVVKPSYSHSFDAGAAWAYMALQASRMGLHAHGMSGFDRERAPTELRVPPQHRVEAAFALGHLAPASVLPPKLAAREVPSERKPLSEVAFEGGIT